MQNDSRAQESERLLRDFEKTAQLVRPFVADRYGEEGGDALYRGVREKYMKSSRRFHGSRVPEGG